MLSSQKCRLLKFAPVAAEPVCASAKISLLTHFFTCASLVITFTLASNAKAASPLEFSKVRADINQTVNAEVLKTLNGPDGAIFARKSEAYFRTLRERPTLSKAALKTAHKTTQLTATSKKIQLKAATQNQLNEIASRITDLLMADALVGDASHDSKYDSNHDSKYDSNHDATQITKASKHANLSEVDVSQLDILIRDPNFQVLEAKAVQTVQKTLDAIERTFPDGEATTRFSKISCSDSSLHGGLTEYALYDSETQTLEFCARYLPLQGDLASWEAYLSPNAEQDPSSSRTQSLDPTQNQSMKQSQNQSKNQTQHQFGSQNQNQSDDFGVAIAPDESIASTEPISSTIELAANAPAVGALDLHPEVNFSPTVITNSVYADTTDIHRGPASLSAAQKEHDARLLRNRKKLPSKIAKLQTEKISGADAIVPNQTVMRGNPTTIHGDVHATSSSSVAAVSGQLTSNTGIRRSQLPASVHEGFEFRLQYGRLITTFWVVNRGTNYDLVYANSSGSRVTIGIPSTSFSYLQETAESVHHDVNDISRCPVAKIQMHIVSEGEKEQTIAACVQGKTKAAADLRAMGNLLSTLVR